MATQSEPSFGEPDQDFKTTYEDDRRHAPPGEATADSQADDAVATSYRVEAKVISDRWRDVQRLLDYGVVDSEQSPQLQREADRLWDEHRQLIDLAHERERPTTPPVTEPAE